MEWTSFARTFGLFLVTAIAEIAGCYLPLLWLTGKVGFGCSCQPRSVWPFLFGS